MSNDEMEKTREQLRAIVNRSGHGSISRISGSAGLSRQYVSKFRKGEDVGWRALKQIQAAIEAEQKAAQKPLLLHDHAKEEAPPYPALPAVPAAEVSQAELLRLITTAIDCNRTDLVKRLRELTEQEEALDDERTALTRERRHVIAELLNLQVNQRSKTRTGATCPCPRKDNGTPQMT